MRVAVLALAMAAILPAPATAQAGKAAVEFSYTYPAQVRAIPPLRQWLDREAAQCRSKVTAEATAARRDAAKDGYPFHPYQSDREWKVVADTPRFLSLSAEDYDFSGGAHGNAGYAALVWDRTASARRSPLSFFANPRALATAVRAGFCRQLDAQRARKRGNERSELAEFNSCVDPVAQTVILGSASRTRFDRIGFLIAPYEAGPYAEGSYDVTLPVTPAILAAVKPEWRRYFALGTP